MALVVPVREDSLKRANLNEDIIEMPSYTKFMIIDDEGSDIYENDDATIWLSNGLVLFGKVNRISYISIEIITNGQQEKLYIPYRIISRILKDF